MYLYAFCKKIFSQLFNPFKPKFTIHLHPVQAVLVVDEDDLNWMTNENYNVYIIIKAVP